MGCLLFVLAGVMALFAMLGYLGGTASALLVLGVIVFGLFLVSNAGGRIVAIINTVYRFFMAGGLSALSSGDLGALSAKMKTINPLIPNEAAAAFMLLLLIIIIVLGVLLGRYRRFRGAPSGIGLLIGLASGYLIGAYLLASMVPSVGAVLPLPFGLGPEVIAAAPAAAPGTSYFQQLLQSLNAAAPTSLAFIVATVVVAIILAALFATLRTRAGGNGRRQGTRD